MGRAGVAGIAVGLLTAVYGLMDWQSDQRIAAIARRMGADSAQAGEPWWLIGGLTIAVVGVLLLAVSRRDAGQ